MRKAGGKRDRPPLDEAALRELALAYVARFATTAARLRTYLGRKLRERGWAGPGEPDLETLAERLAELGYLDDGAFAAARSRSLLGRGYGERRIGQALAAAGVQEDDQREAREIARQGAAESALRYARRRRLGPFAVTRADDPREREKALGAMVRAGHDFQLSRRLLALDANGDIDLDHLLGEMKNWL